MPDSITFICHAQGCREYAAYVVTAAPILADGDPGPTIEIVHVCPGHIDNPPWMQAT